MASRTSQTEDQPTAAAHAAATDQLPLVELWPEQRTAEFLKISIKTLQAWRSRGGGPRFIRVGRLIRYRVGDLEAFLTEHTLEHTSARPQNSPDSNT